MLKGLDHIIIAVRDLDDAAARTARMLGCGVSWSGVHPAMGTGNRLFRLDDLYIELMGVVGAGDLADRLSAHLEAKGEGVFGVSFATDDAEACKKFFEDNHIVPVMIQEGSGRNDLNGAERHWRLVLPSLEATRGLFLFAIEHRSAPDLLPFLPRDGDEAACVKSLDHLVIRTNDPDAVNGLLGAQGMGLDLRLDHNVPEFGGRQMFFRLPGALVEVVQTKEDQQKKLPDHIWGLAWRVADIVAAHDRLESQEFNVSPVRKGRKKGTSVFTLRSAPAQIPTLFIGPEVA